MLRTVHLVGSLAKKYGRKPITIEGDTTQMVMQGLIARFGPGFKQTIRDGRWNLTKNKKPKEALSVDDFVAQEEVTFTLGKITDIWLCPPIKAASAALRVVLGVVLIVVGYFTSWAGGVYLIQIGVGLVLGGVSELLAPKPKVNTQQQAGQNPSFLFNGTVNVTEQGGPVPVTYGRVQRASSLVLSVGQTTENIPT